MYLLFNDLKPGDKFILVSAVNGEATRGRHVRIHLKIAPGSKVELTNADINATYLDIGSFTSFVDDTKVIKLV